MASPEKTIAFIGLGVMGYPMALNLRKKIGPEYTILICDVVQDALQRFQDETKNTGQVKRVQTGFEAVQKADLIITMLPSSPAVRSVYLDEKTGILAGVKDASLKNRTGHKIIMECGTIETATILYVAEATRQTALSLPSAWKLAFVDAPVSGGPMGAQAGTLTFMVGADSATNTDGQVFARVKAALSHMASQPREALNIGVKMGLDPKLLTDVINTSGGQCWVTSHSNPVPGVHPNAPASRDYEGGFRIELCKKVLAMGSELAEMVGARTILDKPTLDAFEEAANDARYQGKDARVVFKWLNEHEKKD